MNQGKPSTINPTTINPLRHLLTLGMLLLLLAATAWSQTAPAKLRLALQGSVSPDGLGKPSMTRGDNVDLEVALMDADGTLVDITTIQSLTLELYASSESTTQISTSLTLTDEDIVTISLPNWEAGTAQHATFELGSAQTNVAMSNRQITCWGVIYAVLDSGARRTFGAGTINLRNGNAGGDPPDATLDPLYPTLAQMVAYTARIVALEALTAQTIRLKEMVAADGYELTALTRDGDDVVTTATVKWSDGTAGVFTTTTKNATYLVIDAFTITYLGSTTRTITQPAVTRNANGAVTTKPALTIAP